MDSLTEDVLTRCNFCPDPGLVKSSDLERHILQKHYHQLFHCLLCSSLGYQPGGFEKFVDVAKHVVEELLLDSTDRKKICQKIVCPGNTQDLKVFRCLLCPYEGMAFVGVAEEVFLKHVSDQHGAEAVSRNPHKLVWECRVCRGLLRNDADLTRHIVKRHAGSNRSIFNNFPFGAFTNGRFKAPVAQTFANEELKLGKLENRINYETKLSELDETINNINDENENIDNKLDDTEPEVKNGSNNETRVSFLEDNISELSYSETDETRFVRRGSDDSDLWSEHNDSFFLENIANNNTKDNDSEELTQRTRNKISNDDEPINSDTNANKEVSFFYSHCLDAFIHNDTAEALLKDVHNILENSDLKPRENLLEKDEMKDVVDILKTAELKPRKDLLEKADLKPPSFLVEVVCRICQPVHRVVAKSCTQLYRRVADHMEKHREVCSEGEARVRYSCRLCVDREWDHLSQVLGHVGRRHKGETTRSRESFARLESPSRRRAKGEQSPRSGKSKESPRRVKGEESPRRRKSQESFRRGKRKFNKVRHEDEAKPSSTLDKYDEKNRNEKKARKSSNLKKYQHDKKFYSSENFIKSVQLKERFRAWGSKKNIKS